MEFTIKIEDLISQEEMKDIAKEEFRDLFREKSDKERILSNLAYYLGEGFVQSVIDEHEVEKLKAKTKEVLNDNTSLRMFIYSKPDAWQHKPKENLLVYNEVQNTIKENIHLVRENIIKELENIDVDNFKEEFDLNYLFGLLIKSVRAKD